MTAPELEDDRAESYLEIQMDRPTIVLAAGAVLVLVVGAFLLGSWYGSRASTGDDIAGAAPAAEPEAATLEHDGEDLAAEDGFGGKDLTARGAPPVGAVPVAPTPRASVPGPTSAAAAATSPPKSQPASRVVEPAARATAAAPRPTAARATAAAAPAGIPTGESWVIQVAAVKDRAEATRLADRLRGKGYPVRVIEDAGYVKVQAGPYATKADAQAAEQRLKREEKVGTWLKRA